MLCHNKPKSSHWFNFDINLVDDIITVGMVLNTFDNARYRRKENLAA